MRARGDAENVDGAQRLGTNAHPPEARKPAATMTQRKCRLFLVDAFTRERFCGNPAVVVLDADVLEEQEMRRIAREMTGIEVAFVLGSDSPDYDVELRFFSPRREVTFVGHATVAAHYVRAMADGVPQRQGPPEVGGRASSKSR